MTLLLYVSLLCLTLFLLYVAQRTSDKNTVTVYALKGHVFSTRTFVEMIAFLPLFLILGLRGASVGTDTSDTYYKIFQNAVKGWYQNYADNSEFGFNWFNKLVSFFTDNYFWIIFLCAFFSWWLFYRYILRDSISPIVSILIFFFSFNFFHQFNAIRQMIALAIVLNAFKYIYTRDFKKYLLCIIIAMTIHSLSFLLIFLYFLYNKKVNLKVIIITVVASLISFRGVWHYVMPYLQNTKYYYYINLEKYYSGYALSYILIAFSILLIGYFVKVIYKVEDKRYEFNMWLQLVSLIVALNAPYIPEAHRVFWLFAINSMIFIPIIIKSIRTKGVKYIIFSILFSLFLIDFLRCWSTGMDQVQQYQLWFFNKL